MSTTTPTSGPAKAVTRRGDRIFSGLSVGSGILILATLAAVAAFLVYMAMPAVTADSTDVRGGEGLPSYVAPLIFGTLYSSIIALLIAMPLSIGIALFITHYAPRRLAAGLGYVIDLLAAVPSIIFGLWGLQIAGNAVPAFGWLNRNLGWFPPFGGDVTVTGRTMLMIGIVLAIMILPIMTAVNREVFLQTPRLHEEASLALGATRWEMIRQAVIPFGKSGVISGAMLGLGRALGETMAVAIVLSASGSVISWELLSSNASGTIAGDIALNFPESFGVERSTLFVSGLALFAVTLLVNIFARWIISRRSEFSGAN
ncbi:phosphate ABC transporter permease subunit PstC [Janibacter melonis]|uniref:Phosphate transport system permease protein n=1 Tax=Janibacter melonis TaxID=262209 RepID=A0A5P8FQS0_9MICO|nr:phosphate ABC transporter permease subunit PstC [Janibacter melonis]MCB5991604.1 phosphate ABC transporter permease subunit PstC [Janibacter melonis]MCM3553748.1 phosphate ABC transporter permease subunit PstC [Janibacter melonis]QFQ31112.2 phosphate ABC transporter permease subunit PstC [Janibacter melonis]